MNKRIILVATLIIAALTFSFVVKEKRKVIFTPNAPKPIGPYSQGILTGNTLYVAGQVGLNPSTGKLDSTGIEGETRQALKNISAILEAAEMTIANVAKTTIYLKNVKDFEKVNKEYAAFFVNVAPPARETIGIADLPKGANIEISVIAVKE
jgi:2-iminobutanoate/2-iminopropanoate deaminase